MWWSALWCRRFRIHRYVAAPSLSLYSMSQYLYWTERKIWSCVADSLSNFSWSNPTGQHRPPPPFRERSVLSSKSSFYTMLGQRKSLRVYIGYSCSKFEFVVKSAKKHQKRYRPTGRKLLHTVIDVKNSIFLSLLVDNLFRISFLQLFQRIRNQHQILRFFQPILHFSEKKNHIVATIIITFYKLWRQTRTKRLKKTEKLFYKWVLELTIETINGPGEPRC
jgi:hypothetical protein